MAATNEGDLPKWQYQAPQRKESNRSNDSESIPPVLMEELINLDLGNYRRSMPVSNLDQNDEGRAYFDLGLLLMLSYQHEMAFKCFLGCLHYAPYCVLAHALVALCQSPNYNFKGDPYYDSTNHPDAPLNDADCYFPSQQVADRHSAQAVQKLEQIRKMHRGSGRSKNNKHRNKSNQSATSADATANGNRNRNGSVTIPSLCSDVEVQLIHAVRILTCNPGIDGSLSEEAAGRPYVDAMRKVHANFPDDPEIAWLFAEGLMTLNAWKLYSYPTGTPLSPDVEEVREVLETSLQRFQDHMGLSHMYVHLSEMSPNPSLALPYCGPLRAARAGHLIHMPTHIDVLVGDYESCVRYNHAAILADGGCMKVSPSTAGPVSFYFGYIVHNYHMLCYGCILGGFEEIAMRMARKLNDHLSEDLFVSYPELTSYLESYSALEVHVMVRFGRWKEILERLELPQNPQLMLFRTATIIFAKALSYVNTAQVVKAKQLADEYDQLRNQEDTHHRILHNNSVRDLLAVDAPMLRGEIAYHEGRYESAFELLRTGVKLQDQLHYDEPWGKMQPIRHALGGLLVEQGHLKEGEEVFRQDLKFHPKNPWGLQGLIKSLQLQVKSGLMDPSTSKELTTNEIPDLLDTLREQRKSEYADFDVEFACECCRGGRGGESL